MADEVIIEEYAGVVKDPSTKENLFIPRDLLTTQVLDIGTLSAAFDDRTAFIRVQSNTTAFWYKTGGSAPSATANTDGNRFLPANGYRDVHIVVGTDTKIDTAADE